MPTLSFTFISPFTRWSVIVSLVIAWSHPIYSSFPLPFCKDRRVERVQAIGNYVCARSRDYAGKRMILRGTRWFCPPFIKFANKYRNSYAAFFNRHGRGSVARGTIVFLFSFAVDCFRECRERPTGRSVVNKSMLRMADLQVKSNVICNFRISSGGYSRPLNRLPLRILEIDMKQRNSSSFYAWN